MLKEKKIRGDGNCMFRSIAHQIENNQEEYEKYREIGIDYLKSLDDNTREEINIFIDTDNFSDIDDYIEKMSQDKEYGDQIILQALSNALQRRIVVYESIRGKYEQIQVTPKKFITDENIPIIGDDIYIKRSSGERGGHYDSLVQKN